MAADMNNQAGFIQQLETFIAEYESLAARSQHDDLSDLHMESARLASRLQAAFDRITSPNDTYGKAAEALRDEPDHVKVVKLSFLAYALRDDLNSGWLDTITELVHAETTTGILQIAQDLVDAKYKDAAAVVCGTAVELHLRALCDKEGVDVLDAKGKPRKADQLRSDLHSKTNTTSKPQDRRITYWLTVRNEAAHGNYGEYTIEDVETMITEVTTFIGSMPA
jgi:hypothetical protein